MLIELRNLLREYGINISITDRYSVLNIINSASEIEDKTIKDIRSSIIKLLTDIQCIYLVENTQVNALCQQCENVIRLCENNLSEQYIACSCGQIILIVAKNQRSHPRQPVNLTGIYRYEKEDTRIGEVIIEDLSYGGARVRNLSPYSICQDDQLAISFTIDDSSQTVIHKRASVVNVKDELIGLKFIEESRSDHVLATYLGIKWIKK